MLGLLLCAAQLSAAPVYVQEVESLALAPQAAEFMRPPARQDMPQGAWQRVQLPHVSEPRSLESDTSQGIRTTYYRLPVPASAEPLFLYLPRWQTVGQLALYGDGRLLWRSTGDRVWNGFNTPLWWALDALDGQPRPHELLLRMDSLAGLGGGISSIWLGSEAELLGAYRLRLIAQVWLPAAIGVAVLALGIFALGVWSRRRHEPIYILFFIAAVFYCLRILHFLGPLDTRLLSADWFGWITINSIGWMVAINQRFTLRLSGRPIRWLEFSLFGFMLASTLLTLPLWQSSVQIAALASLCYMGGGLMFLLSIPLVIGAAQCSTSWLARMLAWGGLLGVLFAIHDISLQNYRLSLDSMYLVPYWQIGFCLLFCMVLGQRYLASIHGLERSQELLALRLAEREAELQESHQQLREVERREVLAGERQRLMQDMHDGLGASLVGALQVVKRGEWEAERIEQVLRDCLDDMRLAIDTLAPQDNDLNTLLGMLRYRLEPRLRAAGLALAWRVEALPALAWLSPDNALHVMRIVQEALTNILKHAGASRVELSAWADVQAVHLRVLDDGRGMPASAVENMGRGLGNIRSRAAALGGTVSWSAGHVGIGTCLSLDLPLR